MFPRQLAEGPFSLRAGHVCDALSVSAELLPGGEVGQVAVVPTRVRISHKFTYDQADKLIRGALDGSSTSEVAAPPAEAPSSEGEEQPAAVTEAVTAATVGPEVVADLAVLRRAADQRRVYRESKGCIEIPLPETKVGGRVHFRSSLGLLLLVLLHCGCICSPSGNSVVAQKLVLTWHLRHVLITSHWKLLLTGCKTSGAGVCALGRPRLLAPARGAEAAEPMGERQPRAGGGDDDPGRWGWLPHSVDVLGGTSARCCAHLGRQAKGTLS